MHTKIKRQGQKKVGLTKKKETLIIYYRVVMMKKLGGITIFCFQTTFDYHK